MAVANPAQADFQALLDKARTAAKAGAWDSAESLYSNAVNAFPLDVNILVGAAQAKRHVNKNEEARALLDRALFHHPSDAAVRMELARLDVADKQFDDALNVLKKLADEGVDNPSIWTGILRCLRELKQQSDYPQTMAQARAAYPGDAAILTECALLQFDLARYVDGIEMLLDAGNRSKLLECLWDATEEQVGLLNAAVLRFPYDAQILRTIADAFLSIEQDLRAVEVFQMLLNVAPSNEHAVQMIVGALKRAGKLDKARDFVRRAMSAKPDDRNLRLEYGSLLWERGSPQDAVALCTTPADVIRLLRKGSGRAGDLLRQALDTWPDDPSLLFEFARVQEDRTLSEQILRYLWKSSPRDKDVALELLRLLQQAGRVDEADEVASKALKTFASDRSLADEAAKAALAAGDADRAARIWIEGSHEQLISHADRLRTEGRSAVAAELIEAGLKHNNEKRKLHDRAWRTRQGDLWVARADTHLESREYEPAIVAYRKASSLFSSPQESMPVGVVFDGEQTRKSSVTAARGDLAQAKSPILNIIYILTLLRNFHAAQPELEAAFKRFGKSDHDLRLRAAWLTYGNGDYDAALTQFKKLHEESQRSGNQQPQNNAAEGLALCLRRARNRDDSLQFLGTAINDPIAKKNGEGFRRLILLKGDLLLEQGKHEAAFECYDTARKDGGVDGYTRAAHLLRQLKRTGEARALIEKGLRELPAVNRPYLWYEAASICISENNVDEARRYIKYIEKAGSREVALNAEGILHYASGDYTKAADSFRELHAFEKHQAYANCNWAWALAMQVKENPSPPDEDELSYLQSLRSKWRQREMSPEQMSLRDAEIYANKALEIDPTYANAHGCLGFISSKRNKLVEAESHFLKSVQESDIDGEYTWLGALYVKNGRNEEAERCLKRACELGYTDAQPRIELSKLYMQTGRTAEAVSVLKEAVAVAPQDEIALCTLAITRTKNGDVTEAVADLRAALSYLDGAKSWLVRLTLGRLYLELADKTDDKYLYSESLRELTKAIHLHDKSADAYFYAGVAAYKQQQLQQAKKFFKQCLDRNPAHFDAGQNLRRIQFVMREQVRRSQASRWGGIIIGIFCCLSLLLMWFLYLTRNDQRIDSMMVMTLSPILLGVAVMGIILPYLEKFRLPGIQAEMSRPKEPVAELPPPGPIGLGRAGDIGRRT